MSTPRPFAATAGRRTVLAGGSALAAAAALASCSSSSSGDGSDSSSDGILVANATEPQNPLVPTNTNETGGAHILYCLFSGLMTANGDGDVVDEMAESVESDDSQHWTIKLKDGWTFTNGEKVTSDSFINAWNYGANVNNAQVRTSSYLPIEGYDAVSAEGAAADAAMSGLVKDDDLTFTVNLTAPNNAFRLQLAHYAFSPLPQAFFDDPEAFGETPVGNGPYVLDSWSHNERADLSVNADYAGPRTPQNKGVSFVFYQDPDTAYNDLLSGGLGLLDLIPSSAVATFLDDLGDRAINDPAAIFQSITLHEELEHFTGDEGKLRRQAISRAIDRESICDKIFYATRTPAVDFSAPVVAGYSDSVPGNEVLSYDAAAAKELWAQAEAISPYGDTTFTIGYNADGGHKDWVDAVCRSIANALGIKAQGESYPDFKSLRDKVVGRTMTGAFRTGYGADYPAASNFLDQLYASSSADGKGGNDSDYKNEEFDAALAAGLAAADEAESTTHLTEAQAHLMEDLPAIPLWYQNAVGGHAENVGGVALNWEGYPLAPEFTVS